MLDSQIPAATRGESTSIMSSRVSYTMVQFSWAHGRLTRQLEQIIAGERRQLRRGRT
jgi:hypothetical protein